MNASKTPVIIETGVKAIDLYAPLALNGRLAIRGDRGTGQLVVAFEIVHNVHERQGMSAHFVVAEDEEQFRRGLREAGVAATVAAGSGPTRAELRQEGAVVATISIGDDPTADSWAVLTRSLLLTGQLPAVDGTLSDTRLELGAHAELAAQARGALVARSLVGASILAFLRQWFTIAEPWTGQPGEYASLQETLAAVRQFVGPAA